MTDKYLKKFLECKDTQWIHRQPKGNDIAFVKSVKINLDNEGHIDRFRSQVTFSVYHQSLCKGSEMEYLREDYNSLKFFTSFYVPSIASFYATQTRSERVLLYLERSINSMKTDF